MKRLLIKYSHILIAVLLLVGYVAFFRTAEVVGTSMEPTYNSRDLLFLLRTKSVESGDIVAIYSTQLDKLLCKRVIGVAGDHVVVNETGLFLNDELVSEDYVSRPDWYSSSVKVDTVVPDGQIFVMGDNRIVSNDSRELGCIPNEELVGVVLLNVTQMCGVRRDTLVRVVTLLFVALIVSEIVSKLRPRGGKTTE